MAPTAPAGPALEAVAMAEPFLFLFSAVAAVAALATASWRFLLATILEMWNDLDLLVWSRVVERNQVCETINANLVSLDPNVDRSCNKSVMSRKTMHPLLRNGFGVEFGGIGIEDR